MPYSRLVTTLVCLVGLLISTAAEARHRHHASHRQYQRQVSLPQNIVCDQWGCRGEAVERVRHGRRSIRTVRKDVIDPNGNTVAIGGLVGRARAYNGMTAGQIGLHRRSQWCMAFLRHIGVGGPVDDRAISALRLPHVQPQVGAIAVYPHHVGIVTGFSGSYPIIISGNSNGRRVYEGVYPRRPIAYVSG